MRDRKVGYEEVISIHAWALLSRSTIIDTYMVWGFKEKKEYKRIEGRQRGSPTGEKEVFYRCLKLHIMGTAATECVE